MLTFIGLEFKIVFVSLVHTRHIVEELKFNRSSTVHSKCVHLLGNSVISEENLHERPDLNNGLEFVDLGFLTSESIDLYAYLQSTYGPIYSLYIALPWK